MKRMAAELRCELEGQAGWGRRPTENIALTMADNKRLDTLERTIAAVERVLAKAEEYDRRLVRLVYWDASCNVTGAALRLQMAPATAYRHLNAMTDELAKELRKMRIFNGESVV